MEDFEAEKKRVEEKIKQRRTEREERERREEIEREKKRRETGSEIVKTRELIEQQERIRLAEEFRREKLEKERHKQSVLEQIRADREAMKRDNGANVSPSSGPSASIPVASTSNKVTQSAPNKCKLAIRFPNGQSITHDFTPNEQLAAVRLFISLNRKDVINHDPSEHNFSLILPPSRSFSDEDYNRTLLDLGLCPSSRLIVQNTKKIY